MKEQDKELLESLSEKQRRHDAHKAKMESQREAKVLSRERHNDGFYKRIAKMAPYQLV